MKPTVISNANVTAPTGSGNLKTGGNDVTVPINHEYRGHKQSQFNTQPGHYAAGEARPSDSRSSGHVGRGQQQQPSHQQHQQDLPSHFQDFDFEPGVGVDMFPRTRLGRMTQDPFGDFGGTARKRSSLHDPHFHTDGFSRYFDEAADFGFPQFNSLGRRRINHHNDDDDLFNRFPSEFRHYIPESFAHRRAGSNMTASPGSGPTMVHPQQSAQQPPQSHFYTTIPPQSPSRKLCDAAIQTEDPNGRCEVDHIMNAMDMGVPLLSSESQSPKSSSVPPMEQQQNQQQYFNTHPTQIPVNVLKRPTPPPTQQHQFATQTSPQIQTGGYGGQTPQFQKTYCAPQHQSHSQQKQQTPPPQATGASYVRTIPIYVEGRTEPIINNKEIPNQNTPANSSPTAGNYRAFTPPKQQTQRLSPLNTQQQPTAQSSGPLPQTPHTVDTINKIQDIQRDVLALMSRVEKFTGTRVDKEYVYLDEMLTRNLLKLDNIDTNGKESIRLARKEAIKCIQASINVLEAKAEENKVAAQLNTCVKEDPTQEAPAINPSSPEPAANIQKLGLAENAAKETITSPAVLVVEPAENKTNDPIPLPPPENAKFNEVKIEDCPEDDVPLPSINDETIHKAEDTPMENSSEAK